MLKRLCVSLLVFGLVLAGVSPVFAQSSQDGAPGAIYVMTNAPDGNEVVAFARSSDGSLSRVGAYATGGKGSGVGLTVPPDPLGSQNSLILSPDGRWLFAVNAGSDTLSVFRTGSDGLNLVDMASSMGNYPVSLALYRDILYVLNAGGDGSIAGFKVGPDGRLAPLAGSVRSLHAATPAMGAQPNILEAPAQIGFSPNGKFLVVTDKGGVNGIGKVDVFRVDHRGLPSASYETTMTEHPVPFSFIFDLFGHLVLDDASASTVTTYAIMGDGDLQALTTVATGQAATCWIAGTPGGLVFTDNTGGNSISALRPASDGSLTVLNDGGPAASLAGATLPLDVATSQDGRYLYSLEVGIGKVGVFMIGPDGSLTSLGAVDAFLGGSGAQGIAAR